MSKKSHSKFCKICPPDFSGGHFSTPPRPPEIFPILAPNLPRPAHPARRRPAAPPPAAARGDPKVGAKPPQISSVFSGGYFSNPARRVQNRGGFVENLGTLAPPRRAPADPPRRGARPATRAPKSAQRTKKRKKKPPEWVAERVSVIFSCALACLLV